MAELKVAKMDEFKGVSVTAERWLPLSEVPAPALPEWLAFKRSEGYALVGLEQTTGSVLLTKFRWPQRRAAEENGRSSRQAQTPTPHFLSKNRCRSATHSRSHNT